MASSQSEIISHRPIDPSTLHLRSVAETILASVDTDKPPVHFDVLPVAGIHSLDHQGQTISLYETIDSRYRPLIIFDLDDTLWPHVEHLVRAVSEAVPEVAIDMDYFKTIGHTRKIPQWQSHPKVMEIHDQIVNGQHPQYFPYVNQAYEDAASVVQAVIHMGHLFCFLTARPPSLFQTTLKTMAWGNIPHNHQISPVDALTHTVPQLGQLYCAYTDLLKVNDYKSSVVGYWLNNLRTTYWQGRFIIIDDLLKPFSSSVESGEVIGISLAGPLNHVHPPLPGETRLDSWKQIGTHIEAIHQEAINNDPSPWRLFHCSEPLQSHLLVVNKKDAGTGCFQIDHVRSALVESGHWLNDREPIIKRLSIS